MYNFRVSKWSFYIKFLFDKIYIKNVLLFLGTCMNIFKSCSVDVQSKQNDILFLCNLEFYLTFGLCCAIHFPQGKVVNRTGLSLLRELSVFALSVHLLRDESHQLLIDFNFIFTTFLLRRLIYVLGLYRTTLSSVSFVLNIFPILLFV